MTNSVVNVQIVDQFSGIVSKEFVEETVLATLNLANPGLNVQVDVLVCDDQIVKELNSKYRGINKKTDVLSFSFKHHGHFYGHPDDAPIPLEQTEFLLPPNELEDLGEVIVSLPQARRQARDKGRSLDDEVSLLLIHGVLHLLGHDHEERSEELAMQSLQDAVFTGRHP